MEQGEFLYIGKVLKPYGNDGSLTISVDLEDAGMIAQTESVFVVIDNERVPFFFESFEAIREHKAIIRFSDVSSREAAQAFTGREIYLPPSELPAAPGKTFYRHEVIGFTVIDKHYGTIGIITGLLTLPNQSVLQVRSGDHEILVPAVDEIILKTDRKRKIVHIDAPEGLIDLYT